MEHIQYISVLHGSFMNDKCKKFETKREQWNLEEIEQGNLAKKLGKRGFELHLMQIVIVK